METDTSRDEEHLSEEGAGWETVAVGKLKVWKPQEESECRRMEPQMVKNNSIVQIMWHSTGVLNLLLLRILLCFEKRALYLIVLIAADQAGLLAFWVCCFVQQPAFSSLLV